MAAKKSCPFQPFGTKEDPAPCTQNRCALWARVRGREEVGACSFLIMADRISAIEVRFSKPTPAMGVK